MAGHSSPSVQSVLNQLDVVLKKKRSLPRIRPPTDSEHLFKYVLEVNDVLHTEYIEKQKVATEVIGKCVKLIREERANQLADLKKCESGKDELLVAARALNTKFATIQTRQTELSERVEAVLQHLNSVQPLLSQAELDMKIRLETIQKKCSQYNISLKELLARQQFQEKAAIAEWNKRTHAGDARPDENRSFSDEEIKSLETLLKKQNMSTKQLIERVNYLKQLVSS